jgi:plasmid stabilization system protein ParE
VPRLIITEGAALGLERCRYFLADKSPQAAERAGRAIAARLRLLQTTPAMGRPFDDDAYLRDLPIPFGESGYIALYRFEPESDAVYVLAVRHQREAGYR